MSDMASNAATAFGLAAALAITALSVVWLAILPTIGLLWLLGWLA